MINIRFIISTLLLIAISIATPTFAGEYKVIVLPNSTIDVSHKNKVNNVDIEEMLAKKVINRMEEQGLACAPTLNILRIGIINNPYFSPNASNPMNNAKIISKSYNVPKVLLISSKVIVKTPAQQREFWKSLNIPALTSAESDLRLITTATMYDMKTDQVLWSDVYQQKMGKTSEGVHSIKLAKVNSYYDKITDRMLEDLKTTTSTSAILVGENKIPEWGKGGRYAINRSISDIKPDNKKTKTIAAAQEVQMVQPKVTKVKLTKEPQNTFLRKIQLSWHNKCVAFQNFQTKREIENARKLVGDNNQQVKENKKTFPKLSFKKQNSSKKISEKTTANKFKLQKKETKITANKAENKVAKTKPIKVKKSENKIAKNIQPTEKKTNSFGKNVASSFNKTKENMHNFVANLKPKKADKVAKKESKPIVDKKVKNTEKKVAQKTQNVEKKPSAFSKTKQNMHNFVANLKPKKADKVAKKETKPIVDKKVKNTEKKVAQKPHNVEKKPSTFSKTKQNVHNFVANLKPKKTNKVAKEKQETVKKVNKTEKKIAKAPMTADKKIAKVAQTPKVTTKANRNSFGKKMAASFNKTKQNVHNFVANLKPKKHETVAKEKPQIKQIKEEKKTVITEQKAKQTTVKTAKSKAEPTKQASADKPTIGKKISGKINGKYTQVKQAYIEKRNKQIQQEKKEEHYTTVIAPVTDGDENINSYIQTKPKNNSWNYTPRFNSLVNDI